MAKYKIGVITFPGSNCDQDVVDVFQNFFPSQTDLLWHENTIQDKYDFLAVPGGFTYGDYLRAGALAHFAPAMVSLKEHVAAGRPVVGICNGFQILCESGLLPGALIRNHKLKHICKDVALKTNTNNNFTKNLDAKRSYIMPVSHSEGNYRAEPDTIKEMEDNNQIVFEYEENINGSVRNIAGVTDKNHRVLGMMPHPDRAADPVTGGTDGKLLLESFLATLD